MDFNREQQIVAATGLTADYRNAWARLPFIVLRAQRGESISEERVTIEDYRTYLSNHVGGSQELLGRILSEAKPGKIEKINSIVAEFNARSITERVSEEIVDSYLDRIDATIDKE